MSRKTLVERFRSARSDPALAVLEGFHPLKHAIRFGAELIETVGLDMAELEGLRADFAPDIAGSMDEIVGVVPPDVFRRLAPIPPPTGVIAIARRPEVSLSKVLNDPSPSSVVLLENPRNLLNIGAAVRVAAAAGAAGVVTTGPQDPWNPAALIAGAGLQYALPVTRTSIGHITGPDSSRLLVVVDPSGEPLEQGSVPAHALLAFGSERGGISPQLMALADGCVSIPMAPGVSSLNLATAVAVVLYSSGLTQHRQEGPG
jgi:TrmH family RNA methyltransferase